MLPVLLAPPPAGVMTNSKLVLQDGFEPPHPRLQGGTLPVLSYCSALVPGLPPDSLLVLEPASPGLYDQA